MLNKIRGYIAKAIGYQQMLAQAIDCIGILNKEACKYQGEAHELRQQLAAQRAEFLAEIEDLENRARRNAEHFSNERGGAFASGLYELVEAASYGGERDFLRPVTERMASYSFDMADCHGGGEGKLFFLKGDKLVPVTLGQQFRLNPDDRGEIPFEYAESAMLAEGDVVGYVTHTDH